MNSAMKQLAAERAARKGGALPRQTPKPAPRGSRVAFTGSRVKPEAKAAFAKELNSVPHGLEELVKPLCPGDASTVHTRLLGVAQNLLDAPQDMSANGPRVVNKEKFLRALLGARKPEDVLNRVGFVTRSGADRHGKQVDWLVLDVVNETEDTPSDLQKLRRIKKASRTRKRETRPSPRPRAQTQTRRTGRGSCATTPKTAWTRARKNRRTNKYIRVAT